MRNLLIRDKALTLIFGPSETYKTFINIDLCGSVTTGVPALGHFRVLRTGDAVLCLDEDPDLGAEDLRDNRREDVVHRAQ